MGQVVSTDAEIENVTSADSLVRLEGLLRLTGTIFYRVHRNALVNVNHVRKMTSLSSQRWMLTLTNGQQMTVSKRLAKTVREILQW